MSVQSEINRISGAVQDALAALTEKGVTVPGGAKVGDLATLIAAIESASVNFKVGTLTMGTDKRSPVVITHGLGEIPRLFFLYVLNANYYKNNTVNGANLFVFISGEAMAAVSDSANRVYFYALVDSNTAKYGNDYMSNLNTGKTSGPFIYMDCSDMTITLKQRSLSLSYGMGNGKSFKWVAVGSG